jgi:hypothetical protein
MMVLHDSALAIGVPVDNGTAVIENELRRDGDARRPGADRSPGLHH